MPRANGKLFIPKAPKAITVKRKKSQVHQKSCGYKTGRGHHYQHMPEYTVSGLRDTWSY